MAKHAAKTNVGDVFGRLTVVKLTGSVQVGKSKKHKAICSCSCGRTKSVFIANLRAGKSLSCGTCVKEVKRGKPDKAGLANAKYKYSNMKRAAAKRGLDFTISFHEFIDIVSKPCCYCGVSKTSKFDCKYTNGPRAGESRCNGAFFSVGIDRYDSSKGYVFTNCVPCCKQCNLAKLDYTFTEFIDWVRLVRSHEGFKSWEIQKQKGHHLQSIDLEC